MLAWWCQSCTGLEIKTVGYIGDLDLHVDVHPIIDVILL